MIGLYHVRHFTLARSAVLFCEFEVCLYTSTENAGCVRSTLVMRRVALHRLGSRLADQPQPMLATHALLSHSVTVKYHFVFSVDAKGNFTVISQVVFKGDPNCDPM
jgi:hypothetical protein